MSMLRLTLCFCRSESATSAIRFLQTRFFLFWCACLFQTCESMGLWFVEEARNFLSPLNDWRLCILFPWSWEKCHFFGFWLTLSRTDAWIFWMLLCYGLGDSDRDYWCRLLSTMGWSRNSLFIKFHLLHRRKLFLFHGSYISLWRCIGSNEVLHLGFRFTKL